MVIKVCNNQEELDQALNDKNIIKVLTIFDKKHENHAACLRTMHELNERCEEAFFLPLDSNQFHSVVEREYFDPNRPIFVVYVGTERVCRVEYTRPKTVERTIQAWTRMKSAKVRNGRKNPDCPDNGGNPFSSY